MSKLSPISVPPGEISITAVRAQGAGGQNVNKVATAVHLRFDVRSSSLSDEVKERLLGLRDRRMTADGVVVIKAQRYRTQEANRDDALTRLEELIRSALTRRRPRKATRPTRASRERRLQGKKLAAQTKRLRRPISDE